MSPLFRRSTLLMRFTGSAAVGLAVTACGGGGGGSGSAVVSTPPPPPTLTVSAPAAATTGSASPAVWAEAGGANFASGVVPGTSFPMLQTSLEIGTGFVRPDVAINAQGGTATVELGAVTPTFGGVQAAATQSGYSDLDWTRIGYWNSSGGATLHQGVFVVGYETPASTLPTTGSATFSGEARGYWYGPESISFYPCHCIRAAAQEQLVGSATFTADFGARTVTGQLYGMTYGTASRYSLWNDVSFTSTITGNAFSGTTSVLTDPERPMPAHATGTVRGRFFGPNGREAGAVWTLYDGTTAVIGTFTGRQR